MWSWILGFIEWRHAVIKWIDVAHFQVNVIIATLKPKVCYRRLWKSYPPACFPPLVLSFCCRLDNPDMALDRPLSRWMMNFRIMSRRAFPCTHIIALALGRECWPSLWLSTISQNVSARCLDGTSPTGLSSWVSLQFTAFIWHLTFSGFPGASAVKHWSTVQSYTWCIHSVMLPQALVMLEVVHCSSGWPWSVTHVGWIPWQIWLCYESFFKIWPKYISVADISKDVP